MSLDFDRLEAYPTDTISGIERNRWLIVLNAESADRHGNHVVMN